MSFQTSHQLDQLIGAPSGPKYEAAIVFDNSREQLDRIRSVCDKRHLQIVQVEESADDFLGIDLSKLAAQYEQTPTNNVYVEMQKLKSDFLKTNHLERYDPVSGIQLTHIKELRDWVSRTSELKYRVALFDWDRTITMTESINIMEPEFLTNFKGLNDRVNQKPWTVADVREHTLRIACGPARLAMLRQAMSMLARNKIDIVLLTNNQGCIDVEMGVYWRNLVQQFFGSIPYKLICSLSYRGDKGLALQTHLPQFCNHPKSSRRDSSPVRQSTRK